MSINSIEILNSLVHFVILGIGIFIFSRFITTNKPFALSFAGIGLFSIPPAVFYLQPDIIPLWLVDFSIVVRGVLLVYGFTNVIFPNNRLFYTFYIPLLTIPFLYFVVDGFSVVFIRSAGLIGAFLHLLIFTFLMVMGSKKIRIIGVLGMLASFIYISFIMFGIFNPATNLRNFLFVIPHFLFAVSYLLIANVIRVVPDHNLKRTFIEFTSIERVRQRRFEIFMQSILPFVVFMMLWFLLVMIILR